jgi:hypothetical protein
VGKAVSLRIPLLPGENVLSQGRVVQDGGMEVRLGAQDTSFSWESSLAPVETLALATRPTDTWIERWHLVASPVWNVSLTGLPPVFESGNAQLEPVWQPWPGEAVNLKVHRPEAIAGATVTLNRAIHEVTLGQRQRLSTLHLSIRCSLGEDFLIEVPAEADITRLTHFGQEIPVRREGSKLVIPLRPGDCFRWVGRKTCHWLSVPTMVPWACRSRAPTSRVHWVSVKIAGCYGPRVPDADPPCVSGSSC